MRHKLAEQALTLIEGVAVTDLELPFTDRARRATPHG
jgi:hypothetical protein